MNNKLITNLIIIIGSFLASICLANSQKVEPFVEVRSGVQQGFTRLVLDSTHKPKWEHMVSHNKITLKIKQAILRDLNPKKVKLPKAKGLIQKAYLEQTSPYTWDAHILFKAPIKVLKAFEILPSSENPLYRVVLDVASASHQERSQKKLKTVENPPLQSSLKLPETLKTPSKKNNTKPSTPKENNKPSLPSPQKWPKIIVVDPGHGGADPGAIGYTKTREKDITLEVAKELWQILGKDKKYKVVLTRTQDKFTSLTDRVNITRESKGDLFISLHADSHIKQESRGLSIYTVSKIASDQEAARLAAKENKADVFLGLSLDSDSPEVTGILIDLMKRETMNLASRFATKLEEKLRPRSRFLDNGRRSADFAVLRRSPDTPGVLIELGYLSNPHDEKLLKSMAYRQKLALGIKEAIDAYFMEN